MEISLRVNPNIPPYNHPFSLTIHPTTRPPITGERKDNPLNNQLNVAYGGEKTLDIFVIMRKDKVLVIPPIRTIVKKPATKANKFLFEKRISLTKSC